MQEYALITGASKGIGRSFARQLAAKKYNLLLVARAEQELQRLAEELHNAHGVDVRYLTIDLSQSGAAATVTNWCAEQTSSLSILINNAGYGVWGLFQDLALKDQLSMLQVNINAVVELTHLLLPQLQQQKQAYILNVASTAAYQAVPTLALYAASKTFVLSFSRALAYELKDSPVSVTCLSPGPTATNFASRAGMDALAELAEKFNMQPDDVARTGLNAMFKRKPEIVPGVLNKLSAFGARHLPKKLIEAISAGLYKH